MQHTPMDKPGRALSTQMSNDEVNNYASLAYKYSESIQLAPIPMFNMTNLPRIQSRMSPLK